jgi:uncharacterized protein YjbI with pentapeptide repeats
MATKQQLIARWETPEGQQIVEDLYRTFTTGVTIEQLHAIVSALPYVDEVAPHLDLRGFHLGKNIFVHNLDLPGVRLDYSSLGGNLSDGNWSGAVFDGANVTRLSFELDLTGASFVKANARKTWFMKSLLNKANFSEAKLIGAHLDDVPCNSANFSGADMREAMCAGCDFRGANLSHANLSSAVFGGVLFDDSTQIQGANFTGTSLSKDFRAFVTEHGEQPKPRDDSDAEQATIAATVDLVQEQVQAGNLERRLGEAVLAALATVQQRLNNDPHYDWESCVEILPATEKAIIYAAYEEGMGVYEDYM